MLFVDASSTGIAGRKTSFGTRTTSPLSFILRRWVSWRLPRRDSHSRSPRTEPSVATRPEVLVFHPISPLLDRSVVRTKLLARDFPQEHVPSTGKSTATTFLPPFPSSIFVDEISRIVERLALEGVFVVGAFCLCEFWERKIEVSGFFRMKFRLRAFLSFNR